MKKYIVEFFGTFFLVLTVIMVSNNGSGQLAPLAAGAVMMGFLYSGGKTLYPHLNPAISLACLMRGRIGGIELMLYVAAQLMGGIFAALIATMLLRCSGTIDWKMQHPEQVCALIAEFLGTFALVWVYLSSTYSKQSTENQNFGLAIAMTYIGCSFAMQQVSGAPFNPALALGMSISSMSMYNDLWISVLGSGLGAAGAASIFQVIYGVSEEQNNE